jgi:hypothetical protein
MSIHDRPHVNLYLHVPTHEFYALRLQSGRFTGAVGPLRLVEARATDLTTLDYDQDSDLLAWVQEQQGQFDLAG